MRSERQVVVDALAAVLPADVVLEPYGRAGLTPAAGGTVLLYMDRVTRSPRAPLAERVHQCVLLVTIPSTAQDGSADDQLDALLADVLYAIEQAPGLRQWTEARRAVYGDSFPAYEVDLPVPLKITDPTT